MKLNTFISAAAGFILAAFTFGANAQSIDAYGTTTTRLLLPVGSYGGTNLLQPTFTQNNVQAQPNPINPNQTNMVFVDTNVQWDVSRFLGRCEIAYMGATNQPGSGTIQIISSNTVYGTLYTNTILVGTSPNTGATSTNQMQVIPFDTTVNGRYLWYYYAVTPAAATNVFGLEITGRLKDN
jgi:hypothetical protein